MDRYCHSFSEDLLWKLVPSWIHSILNTFRGWSRTKASRTESCCWLLPPLGSLSFESPTLALCAFLTEEKCCHPLSWAPHWNMKLSSKTEHVHRLLPRKGFQESKIFLAVNSPWPLICTTNNGARCFPSQGKVILIFQDPTPESWDHLQNMSGHGSYTKSAKRQSCSWPKISIGILQICTTNTGAGCFPS